MGNCAGQKRTSSKPLEKFDSIMRDQAEILEDKIALSKRNPLKENSVEDDQSQNNLDDLLQLICEKSNSQDVKCNDQDQNNCQERLSQNQNFNSSLEKHINIIDINPPPTIPDEYRYESVDNKANRDLNKVYFERIRDSARFNLAIIDQEEENIQEEAIEAPKGTFNFHVEGYQVLKDRNKNEYLMKSLIKMPNGKKRDLVIDCEMANQENRNWENIVIKT